jgi:hypothetical protein
MDLHDGIRAFDQHQHPELARKATDIDSIKKTLFTISRLSRWF